MFVLGGGPKSGEFGEYWGARLWHNPGALANGFPGVCSVFVTAAFSFAGTELVGLAATEHPVSSSNQGINTFCVLELIKHYNVIESYQSPTRCHQDDLLAYHFRLRLFPLLCRSIGYVQLSCGGSIKLSADLSIRVQSAVRRPTLDWWLLW